MGQRRSLRFLTEGRKKENPSECSWRRELFHRKTAGGCRAGAETRGALLSGTVEAGAFWEDRGVRPCKYGGICGARRRYVALFTIDDQNRLSVRIKINALVAAKHPLGEEYDFPDTFGRIQIYRAAIPLNGAFVFRDFCSIVEINVNFGCIFEVRCFYAGFAFGIDRSVFGIRKIRYCVDRFGKFRFGSPSVCGCRKRFVSLRRSC